MTTAQDKPATPPYVSFKSLTTYCDGFRELKHVPGALDRGTMKTFSGATQKELIAALKYLGLTDDKSVPRPLFSEFALADNEARKPILEKILRSSYSFIFKNASFNLDRATENQAAELFRSQGVNGSTNSRAIAFFLSAAKEAGIPVSPHIKAPTIQRTTTPRGRKPKSTGAENRNAKNTLDQVPPPPPGAEILEIPIPINRKVSITLPPDFKESDWTLFKTMLDAYIDGWKKEKQQAAASSQKDKGSPPSEEETL